MLHWEQKCAHFCSEWSIVGYGAGAFWDWWIRSIRLLVDIFAVCSLHFESNWTICSCWFLTKRIQILSGSVGHLYLKTWKNIGPILASIIEFEFLALTVLKMIPYEILSRYSYIINALNLNSVCLTPARPRGMSRSVVGWWNKMAWFIV